MPKFQVTSPDGKSWVVNAPEGATPDQALAFAKQQWSAQQQPQSYANSGEQTIVQSVGSELNQIPRQLGLTARYALEGPAQAAEVVTEPVRKYITDPIVNAFVPKKVSDLVTGKKTLEGKSLGAMASDLADFIGLPKPQSPTERVVGDVTRMGFGAMAGSGAASKASTLLQPGSTSRAVATTLASNPGQQVISAAGAGGAAGASREAGGDPILQAVSGLIGGILAPSAFNAGKSVASAARDFALNRLAPNVVEQRIDNAINLTLNRSGINWQEIDASTRAKVRADVRQALETGSELNGDALRRLIDFRRVGATPTIGGITLDPVQITRERNLAKMGANTSDPSLQRLAQVENQNNATFIRNLNESGASQANDPYSTGELITGALNNYANRQRSNISDLYGRARDSSGRSALLDGATFTQRANQLLHDNLAGKLPAQIEKAMNDIAQGKVPLTVEHAEQLKTAIGRIQRSSSDGNERYAMGLIRQALDEAPLRDSMRANPGNLPAINGSVQPSTAGIGQESIDAFNQARAANRSFMNTVERTPALDAAMNGAAPDNFFSRFVTSKSANAQDVSAMTDLLRSARINPENLPATAEQIRRLPPNEGAQVMTATKNAIVDHLKRQALGGAADEVGNFSQSAYNKALRDIGDRKLSLFFSPEEIQQLHAVGRVASYTQFQPRGSAVNNSNSGAMLAGNLLDFMGTAAARLPLGLKDTVTGTISGVQARRALTPASGLLTPVERQSFADVVGPRLLYGGLLAAPQVVPNR